MPKTKLQGIFFGAVMSVLMAYGMEVYNVSRNMGGLSNAVFIPALKETSYMVIFVFVISTLAGNNFAHKIAFSIVRPEKDNPFFITVVISCCTVWFMCPAMSLVATVVFQGLSASFIADWFKTIGRNFPMAIFWQLFFAGPLTRLIFRTVFCREKTPDASPAQTAE